MEKFMNYKDVRKILSEKFNWEDEEKAPLSMKYQPHRDGGYYIPNPEFVKYCKEKGYWG